MAKIIPFKGLRPNPDIAPQLATLPYDVVNVQEARAYASQPYHFYHVTRSEIDLPEDIDVHSEAVYLKAKENLDKLIADKLMQQDAKPCYYIYELVMNGRSQTGLVCGSSCEDYHNGIIKKHEFTRPEKELDRINHIKTTRAQTGIVFLAYRDEPGVQRLIAEWKENHQPVNNFTSEDGIQHIFWVVDEDKVIDQITNLFATNVPATYIADGHHRAASAAKVCDYFKESGQITNPENPYDHFITCIFPESELKIMDYNRVVKDLNGLSPQQFLTALQERFTITPVGKAAVHPARLHEFGLYLEGQWYRLEAKEGSYTEDPIGVLDVTILQNHVLSAILDIHDPRIDKRVDFVGGIRGLTALEKAVDSGEMAAAFSCYPVSIQQLFDIADSGQVMPPKSTWFEPKTRDGLVVYKI
jgi:uncharacterized protein (DUF1015 family)